jgi:hypothetical protein
MMCLAGSTRSSPRPLLRRHDRDGENGQSYLKPSRPLFVDDA